MLAEERRSRIQDLLIRQSSVTIAALAESLGTSEMTIRRDLDKLETRGICQRVRGGAVSLRVIPYPNAPYPSFAWRELAQVAEKVAIGRAAAGLVERGDVIVIDSGTTAAYMARALRGFDSLTVITNSLRVLDQLHDVTSIALISPGGSLSIEDRTESGGDLAFVGPVAVAGLRNFRPGKAFITTSGITLADGISNASLFQAEIKRTMIEIAETSILMTDHTKFGRLSSFLVASVKVFSKIITDAATPADQVAELRALGIDVLVVEPAADALPLRSPAIVSMNSAGEPDSNGAVPQM
jgi:DeoR family transcriptional regulator, fructose operon transcriptional repressor